MNHWEKSPLGAPGLLVSVRPGFACGTKDVEGGIPHLRMNNVTKDGRLDMTLVRRIPVRVAEAQNRFLQVGDVLFTNTNSTELVGKSCVFSGWSESCAYSNHLTRLRPNPDRLLPRWLQLCLHNLWHEGFFAANCTEFIGQSAFNKDELLAVEIPVPPLAEQGRIMARIVALTRRLEEARQARQAAVAEVERLVAAAMNEAFEARADFLESTLADVCTMKTGKTPPTSHPAYFSGDLPFVCPADVGSTLRISTAERRLSPSAVADGKANLFPPGTVLVVAIGSTTGKIGLAASPLCTNQQITGLTFANEIVPDYAAWFLTSQRSVIRGAASDGGVPIINQKGLGALPFRYPPDRTEQRRIVARLDALRAKVDELQRLQREVEAELAAFTPALLAKAFRGEL